MSKHKKVAVQTKDGVLKYYLVPADQVERFLADAKDTGLADRVWVVEGGDASG